MSLSFLGTKGKTIFDMALTDSRLNISSSILNLHDFVSKLIRFATTSILLGTVLALGLGRKERSQTHGSFQTSTLLSSPIVKQAPLRMVGLSLSIALQVAEEFFIGSLNNQPPCTLYLLLKAHMQGLSHPDTIIQANLANSVALKCLALRKPKPPIALGAHKLAHAFQAKKRLESLLGFHQKRLNEASNLSQIATGTSDEEKSLHR
jgi:hypothetical protein